MNPTASLPPIAPPPADASVRWKLLCAMSLTAMLAACGGGGGVSCPAGVDCSGATPAPSPAPAPAPSSACADVAGAIDSTVRFSTTDKASAVTVSGTGQTACFGSTVGGVRSTTAISPGSFYYFEGKRSGTVSVGVATASMTTAANNSGGTDIVATDQAFVLHDSSAETFLLTAPPANTFSSRPFNVGLTESTFGFAIDYTGTYPVVYVLGSTASAGTDGIATDQCAGTGVTVSASTPCVYGRQILPNVSGPLYIYAYGGTFGGSGSPKVSINGGVDLNARAFSYAPLQVRNALRKRYLFSERSFNAKWAAPTLPTITATSRTAAVVKTDDTTPYTASFTVTAADAASASLTGTAVQWLTDTGALISTGLSLDLTAANTKTVVGTGAHRIQAVVTDPTTKQIRGTDFYLTYTATDSDDDGDGLSYSQEKTLGTDPANADTDGDGLGDGAEVALGGTGAGYNPAVAATVGGVADGRRRASDTTLPLSVQLAPEGGASGTATNSGVVLLDDRLTIALTSQINPDCQLDKGPFAGAGRAGTVNGEEECKKRAIRANSGIKPGEFRYYETHRLLEANQAISGINMGQGFIAATGRIDPFCCVQTNGTQTPVANTPPSFMANSAASLWNTLVSINGTAYNPANTHWVGFAVDYRSGPPKAYAITGDSTTAPVIDGPFPITNFTGDVIPFVYGHPQSDTAPALEINLGLKTFHYPAAVVRSLLDTTSSGASTGAAMTRGVGIHYQP